MTKIKNNSLLLTKLLVAGFFAYAVGQILSESNITYISASLVGLLGVKSFEFVMSAFNT